MHRTDREPWRAWLFYLCVAVVVLSIITGILGWADRVGCGAAASAYWPGQLLVAIASIGQLILAGAGVVVAFRWVQRVATIGALLEASLTLVGLLILAAAGWVVTAFVAVPFCWPGAYY